MSVSLQSKRVGATLPLTVIVLALMAVAVAITYARISSERYIGSDARANLGAFAVAQSGLNRYLSTLNGKPAVPVGWPANPVIQTVTYNDLPGGTAQVDLIMLRESTVTLLPAVYAITSRGTYTAAQRFNALTPPAERTVATYAIWATAPFDLNAAVTTLAPSGIRVNGEPARLSGNDRCGIMGAIPGAATVNQGFIGHPTNIEGAGTPHNLPADLGDTQADAMNEVDIDWAAVLAGTAFPADFVNTWPGSFNNWPVVRYNGDFTLAGSGKGILIVTGNLTWNGTPLKTWEGLILIGGTMTHNGAGNVYGAVISGLNAKVGIPIAAEQEINNGTKRYQYDSCSLARALGHIGSIQRIRNGWTDTWSSY